MAPAPRPAAEALEVVDVRQDDLTSGGVPLTGKWMRDHSAEKETQ